MAATPAVPEAAVALTVLAETLLARGNTTAAREALEQALEAAPSAADLLMRLAALEETAGLHTAASARYQRIGEIQPSNVIALNNLAYALAVRSNAPAQALALARRAVTLAPRNAYVIDTLAWIEHLLGNHAVAAKLLAGAIKLDPEVSDIRLHAATVAAALGDSHSDKCARLRSGFTRFASRDLAFSQRAGAARVGSHSAVALAGQPAVTCGPPRARAPSRIQMMITLRRTFIALQSVCVLAIVAFTATAALGATATWDPNPELNIAGYKLSYGTQSGVHGTVIDVGNVTTFTFNPPSGRYYVVVQAYTTTGELSPKSAEVVVDISATTNQAPTLRQPPDQSSVQNTTVTLALSASDPDGSLLNYKSTGLPPGLTLNALSGVISGVVSTTGTYPVTVTVSDGTLTASRSFTWTVATPGVTVNRAPSLVQPADQTTVRNTSVSLLLSASDPDGTALSYSSTGLPPGLSVNTTSGLIAGIPSQAGSFSVTATVSDGALSASRSFNWTVTDAATTVITPTNRAPSLNIVPDQKHKPNESVSLQLRGTDPENMPLTYSASGLPRGLSVNATSGLISGVTPGAGSYQVTVTVSDGALSASQSFTWTVSASNGKNAVSSPGVNQRLQSAGLLSGVTALQDGTLLLIENQRALSVLAPGSAAAQSILDAGDERNALTEVAVNAQFAATRHVFVGVTTRLDAETSEFAVVRYREVNGSLGEGAAVVSGLRFQGLNAPHFTVDEEERVYVAMPGSERSDAYAAGILRFNADGSVPKDNRSASPLVARGFSQPANLGWDGAALVATGADQQWSYAAARLNPGSRSNSWPEPLEPLSVGTSASIVSAAFATVSSDGSTGLRAYIDSERRLFRLSVDSRSFEDVAIPEGLTPISAAAGFEGQIYLIARADTGEFVLLEFLKDIK